MSKQRLPIRFNTDGPTGDASFSSRKPTILLVDDDDIFVDLLKDELSPHFIVEWAGDGKIAIDAVVRQTPDVIFLDHGLPDTSGVELIDEFRKVGCESPVVMLTASQDVRIAAAAMRAGAVDFIVKDINESLYEDLVPTAIRAVKRWSEEKELEYLRELEEEQARQTSQLNYQLQKKNTEIGIAYREIEASQEQLRQKNQRLSELYETAHRFVDNVSHEMRTPLTVIKEFLSITLDGLAGEVNEQQCEYLNIAMAKTNDLAQMVDDMLDISKLEAGLLRVDRNQCTVQNVIERVEAIVRQKANSYHINVDFDVPEDMPLLYCDAEKAGRVIINLVVNAMKFSGEHSTVKVWSKADPSNAQVIIGVTDQGPGVSPEDLKVIFGRFQQVGDGCRSSTKGFGLGLSIVKELVHLNLGEVNVESEVGKGSTFSFTLPEYDHQSLVERFLSRLDPIARHSQKIACIRAYAENPVGDISHHVHDFVAHYLSALDMSVERDSHNDAIILAVLDDPEHLVKRLRIKNQEELRMSPGSTVDLGFEVLCSWDEQASGEDIVNYFKALFEDQQTDEDVSSKGIHR